MRLRAGTTPRAGNDRPRRLSCFGFGPSFWRTLPAHLLPKMGVCLGREGQHRYLVVRPSSDGKGRLCCRRMSGDIISLVKFRGRRNNQWTGVVSLSSRRLLPTVLTLVVLKSSWQLLLQAAGSSWAQLVTLAWTASRDMDTGNFLSSQLLTPIAINQVLRSEALGNSADRTKPPISHDPHSAKCQPCHAIFPPTPAPLAPSLPSSLGRRHDMPPAKREPSASCRHHRDIVARARQRHTPWADEILAVLRIAAPLMEQLQHRNNAFAIFNLRPCLLEGDRPPCCPTFAAGPLFGPPTTTTTTWRLDDALASCTDGVDA